MNICPVCFQKATVKTYDSEKMPRLAVDENVKNGDKVVSPHKDKSNLDCSGSGCKADIVRFADLAYKKIGTTAQGASHYLDGLAGCPELGEGLQVNRTGGSYHLWTMPIEDALKFASRVAQHWANILGE